MRRINYFVLSFGLVFVGGTAGAQAPAQYPIMEQVVKKVIAKYQTSSCEQLIIEKRDPAAMQEAMKERAVALLHSMPDMRKAFLNQVAPTIVNKMFECGMIP
jgi:glutamyl-tRNA reductase